MIFQIKSLIWTFFFFCFLSSNARYTRGRTRPIFFFFFLPPSHVRRTMLKRISANCQFIGRARAARKNGDELFQPGPASYDRSLSGVSIDFINTANRLPVCDYRATKQPAVSLSRATGHFNLFHFYRGSSPRSTISGTNTERHRTSIRITRKIRLGLISFVESSLKGWSWNTDVSWPRCLSIRLYTYSMRKKIYEMLLSD